MNMIYTVTFNPAIDYVVQMQELALGSVNRSDSEKIFYGGKGINVSVVLAELGVRSKALGFTAGFTGEAIEQGVEAMGIDADFVRLKSGNSRINVKIRAAEETEINGQGPHIDDEALEELFKKLNKLRDGDTLILAGSIPNSLPSNVYERILEMLSDRDIRTVVDAAGELLLNVLKYKPFLIKPNLEELCQAAGRELKGMEEIISEIAANLHMCAHNPQSHTLDDMLHTVACKSAIKANDKNDVTELQSLAEQVYFDERIRHCPHGRPVFTSITRKQLYQLVKRI